MPSQKNAASYFPTYPIFQRLHVYSISGGHVFPLCEAQLAIHVSRCWHYEPRAWQPKPKGSQSSELKKKKRNSTELKFLEINWTPSAPIFVVQPFLFNQRFPRQWLVSESSCLVPLDPTLFLLERRFFGLGKEKQTTKNTAKKQKRLQPIWKICSSNWIIFPGTGKNRKYLKAPPSCCFFQDIWLKFMQFVGKMLVKTLELTVYLQKKTWLL